MKQFIQLILGLSFTICAIGSFSAFGDEDYDYFFPPMGDVRVQLPTVGCKMLQHPAPGSSLMDCRHGNGGQKGFVSNDIDVDSLLVEVYDQDGNQKGRRFLHSPPDTLRRYAQEGVNEDSWIVQNRDLRPLMREGYVVKVAYFRLEGTTDVYEDSALQTQKEGMLGSSFVFEGHQKNVHKEVIDYTNWRLPRASDYKDWGSRYPGVKTN